MQQSNGGEARFEVFFDGDCPLCRREIDWLKKKNKQNKVLFTDIAAPDFEAAKYGKTWDELMAEMHGRLPDGTWVLGLDTFDRLYQELRLGWMVHWTRWPLFRGVTDLAYRLFARNRLRFSGKKTGSCRVAGTCEVNLKSLD